MGEILLQYIILCIKLKLALHTVSASKLKIYHFVTYGGILSWPRSTGEGLGSAPMR